LAYDEVRDVLFVSAGEVSGDHYVARACEKLRERGYSGRFCGLCGAESRKAGIEALWRSERLQLMGVTEVLSSLLDIWRLAREMFRCVMDLRPAALLVADSPDFHLPLIRRLRRGGYSGKIFYISPPSVWAWRSYRAKDLARFVDECLPLFSFEHEYLKMSNAASFWVGHPLVGELSEWSADPLSVLSGIKGNPSEIDPGRVIALLPGSRKSEIEQLYPILSDAGRILENHGFSPVFSIAPGLSDAAKIFLQGRLDSAGQNYYEGPGRDLLALSKAAAGSSGTVTAEALLLGRYMVVLYKLRPLTAFIGKILLSHLFFAIPNLLAKEMFFPELIQESATGAAAARELFKWLGSEDSVRAAGAARMKDLAAAMGDREVYDFWAGRIAQAL
jgi:lipid-A-disaccharide synthase